VYSEIKAYGHEEQKKKLIAGIVITGGGAELKHLRQLVEYTTGMDTRIGYPNEHLAGNSEEAIKSPVYATAVGLVMDSLERQGKITTSKTETNVSPSEEIQEEKTATKTTTTKTGEDKLPKNRKSFFEKWADKFKDFLENAE
jgi:cell division protein FtsA